MNGIDCINFNLDSSRLLIVYYPEVCLYIEQFCLYIEGYFISAVAMKHCRPVTDLQQGFCIRTCMTCYSTTTARTAFWTMF